MKFNTLPKVFQNKYFLYVVALVALGNVLGYLAKEQYNALSFFLAIGLLSSYFSKNMAIVLLISVISTAFVSSQKVVEGQTNMGEKTMTDAIETAVKQEESKVKNKESPASDAKVPKAKKEPKPDGEGNPNDAAVESAERKVDAVKKTADAGKMCYKKEGDKWIKHGDGPVEESKCTGEDKVWGNDSFSCHKWEDDKWSKVEGKVQDDCKGKGLRWCPANQCGEGPQAFTNMKSKNAVAAASREQRVDGVDESVGDRIDYAQTVQQAYGNLQQMLGTDGMKGLASETKKLVAQQKELVDSLGQMAPVLNSAKSTLDSLNLPDMKGITNILSTLKASK